MTNDYNSRGRVPDFSGFPDLVIMYLGMKVRTLPGLKTLIGVGPQIDRSGASAPEGLLHYENNIIFKLFPLHVGMRWYWRDMQTLEAYAKSEPHRTWWKNYVKSAGGTGIWHETYHMRGGMEAIYGDMEKAPGFGAFMPMQLPRGTMASRHTHFEDADIGHLPVEEFERYDA